MPSEIDEVIANAGEELYILRGKRRIPERQFIKLNRLVTKEEYLFNSVKCLFTADSRVMMGDIVYLPKRDKINQYYFIESKNSLIAENENQMYYVSMKRVNCSLQKVIEEKPKTDLGDISTFSYQKNVIYGETVWAFVINPVQNEESGKNTDFDRNTVYFYVPIVHPFHKDDMIRVFPFSDYKITGEINQYYRIRHINITDFPNMVQIKAMNETFSVDTSVK
jgi:hypothetical protein